MNIKDYFEKNSFESSQLIVLEYDKINDLLILVIRYARTQEFVKWLQGEKKPESPVSDFRQITFKEVKEFKSKGILLEEKGEKIVYYMKNSEGSFSIDYMKLNSEELKMRIPLTSPAEIEFNFKSFSVKQKFGRGIKRKNENEWDYVDVKTGEIFDFYDPFNLIFD